MIVKCLYALIFLAVTSHAANVAATIKGITGNSEMNQIRKTGWQLSKIGIKLNAQDQIRTGDESMTELTWNNGGTLRIAENSLITISNPHQSASNSSGVTIIQGQIWANMKKLTTTERNFNLSTPTAVAGIRGTVFRILVNKDSSTNVLVYEGKVAVGPKDILTRAPRDTSVKEVDGPKEVEGPREITLEEWTTIVAGQQIHISSNGEFRTWQFDQKSDSTDSWVKYNMEQDNIIERNK
jgi:hypothetical protein